jgi:hypothetical protein
MLTELTLLTEDSVPSPEKIEKLNEEGNRFVKRIGVNNETVEAVLKLASLKAYYLNRPDEAEALLQKVVSSPRLKPRQKAEAKLALGDVLLYEKKVWDASLLSEARSCDTDPVSSSLSISTGVSNSVATLSITIVSVNVSSLSGKSMA